MERMTLKERYDAAEVCLAESACFGGIKDASYWVMSVESTARALHRLYVKGCNEPLTDHDRARIKRSEQYLKSAFKARGLGLYLNGDPRGNPVGILTPKSGRYNTMGGRECGWRL